MFDICAKNYTIHIILYEIIRSSNVVVILDIIRVYLTEELDAVSARRPVIINTVHVEFIYWEYNIILYMGKVFKNPFKHQDCLRLRFFFK